MTTFSIALKRDQAKLAIDTMSSGGHTASKYFTMPHIGAVCFVSGRAVVLDHLKFSIARLRSLHDFDSLIDVAEDLCMEALESTGREMMDSEGADGDVWQYLEESKWGMLTAEIFFVGYSKRLREMCAGVVLHKHEDGEYVMHKKALRPRSFNGRSAAALDECEQRLGRQLTDSSKDMRLSIGYQFLHGLDQGHDPDAVGGGDITQATLRPDRSISMQILATADECMSLAQPYFEDEAKPQGNVYNCTQKPGRNSPCPCGSGLKYKRCCGE